jgi:hypothetical protein
MLFGFLFWILLGYLKCFKITKYKINFKKLIMISLYDTSSIVETLKIIKFKRNFKKLIMISVLDRSSIVQSFKIIKFKKSNYDF